MKKLSNEWRTPTDLFDELNKQHGPFDIDLCATTENSVCDFYCVDYLHNILCKKSVNNIVEGPWNFSCLGSVASNAFINPPYSNPYPFIKKAWEDSKHCKIVLLVKVDTSTKWWGVFWDYDTELFCLCPYCHTTNIEWCKALKEYRCKSEYCNKMFFKKAYKYNKGNGPKPGCQFILLPKRVQFDPPVEMVESGEVFKNDKGKWVQKCKWCEGDGYIIGHLNCNPESEEKHLDCLYCKGKGHLPLSGPSFPSCVLIFDRRNRRE